MKENAFQLMVENRFDELLTSIDRGEVNNLNADGSVLGLKLMHYAVSYDKPYLIRELARRGADVNCVDHEGRTPLVSARTVETVKALLEAGANINAMDHSGLTPIFHLWGDVETDAIKLLVHAGADVNARNKDGETVLMHHFMNASEMCANEVVSVSALLSAGADVNAVNGSGDTVLHLAADGSIDEDLIEVLLAAGANPSAVNASGLTPSDVANDPGIKAIIQRAVLNAELLSLIESSPDRIKRGDGGI
ncbi:TPA: ankyrin repeat domain-containing protein [Stenotrophomonas maltophilia]|nr:ankyrin repeat domain-containing protein [Stenotrophomonas maltophilia]